MPKRVFSYGKGIGQFVFFVAGKNNLEISLCDTILDISYTVTNAEEIKSSEGKEGSDSKEIKATLPSINFHSLKFRAKEFDCFKNYGCMFFCCNTTYHSIEYFQDATLVVEKQKLADLANKLSNLIQAHADIVDDVVATKKLCKTNFLTELKNLVKQSYPLDNPVLLNKINILLELELLRIQNVLRDHQIINEGSVSNIHEYRRLAS